MAKLTQPTIHKLILDVTLDDQVNEVVKTIIEREGRIDILVNNAGMGNPGECCLFRLSSVAYRPMLGPILDMPVEYAKEAFEVHTFGVWRLSRAVAPHMAQRKSGTIVTIGSITGLL